MNMIYEIGDERDGIDSSVDIDVPSLTLEEQLYLEFEFPRFSNPLLLFVNFGEWYRSFTFVMDEFSPVVSIHQLTGFSDEESPVALTMVDFDELVIPVLDGGLKCNAGLKPLDVWSMNQLVDASQACSEDLTLRALEKAVRITGCQSYSARAAKSQGSHSILVEITVIREKETEVRISLDKNTISDYSGNLNSEDAFLLLHYSPQRPLVKESESEVEDRQPKRQRPCRVAGYVFSTLGSGCIVLSIGISAASDARSARNGQMISTERALVYRRWMENLLLLQTVFIHRWIVESEQNHCFVEFGDSFGWIMFDIELPFHPSDCKLESSSEASLVLLHCYTERVLFWISAGLLIVGLIFLATIWRKKRWILSWRFSEAFCLVILSPLIAATILQFLSDRGHAVFGVYLCHCALTPIFYKAFVLPLIVKLKDAAADHHFQLITGTIEESDLSGAIELADRGMQSRLESGPSILQHFEIEGESSSCRLKKREWQFPILDLFLMIFLIYTTLTEITFIPFLVVLFSRLCIGVKRKQNKSILLLYALHCIFLLFILVLPNPNLVLVIIECLRLIIVSARLLTICSWTRFT